MPVPAAPAPRAVLAAAAVLTAGLLATACSSGGHPAALAGSGSPAASPSHVGQFLPHTSPPAVSPSPSPSRSAPEAPLPTEPAARPVAAGPGPCQAAGLRVGIGSPDGAAGSLYYPLQFTNVSGATCTMYGFPGVAFAAADGGAFVGGQAVRNPTFGKQLVTLAPGATAHASLQVAIAQNYPESVCKPVTARWLAVYPPSSYVADYVSFTAQTCTGRIPSGSTLGIYVVRPGATGP
jgi:hypothetical protein